MNFNSVLIANRGEIACRLIRACQGLGLRGVAAYSDADRGAPHVALADSAVHIGPSEPAQSYLNGGKIIAAAHRAGAEAVHPGYGFLAENAGFAQACIDAGLIFIGPSPENIRLMGSKTAAKAAAVDANVPVVPGYYGEDQSDDTLLAEANKIGTPLLIKASAGGGGRGMRQVHDLADFPAELATARAEAQATFGDGQVLLERYVRSARHIEVQILGDRLGNVRHLYERDCSLQRNHQKVIEEAPAPLLDPTIRRDLLDSALRLTSEIRYDSVGTVEYLYDADTGDFYFLEMNTRLQVEHPVTEAVTGIDIAQWQIRAARGEPLPFAQDDITCTGWSVEARIAAEDPADGYRPEIGTITAYDEPKLPGLRVDSGVYAGSTVSHFYDSMLAKLISQAPDRASAIRLLDRGLKDYRIAGPGNNISFLRDLLAMPAFAEGSHSTASMDNAYPEGWTQPLPTALHLAQAVLIRHLSRDDAPGPNPWTALGAWRLTEPAGRRGAAHYMLAGRAARIEGRGGAFRIELWDHEPVSVENTALAGTSLSFEIDGLRQVTEALVDGDTVTLHGLDGRHSIKVLTADSTLQSGSDGDAGAGDRVISPMPGVVDKIIARPGDKVAAGDPVVVIEAMKLLQTLTALCNGTIGELRCAEGEDIVKGAILAVLIPVEDE